MQTYEIQSSHLKTLVYLKYIEYIEYLLYVHSRYYGIAVEDGLNYAPQFIC